MRQKIEKRILMKKLHKQVARTREWTFEALLLLLKEKPYETITITDITTKAGIARQTFYRNYQSKDDVVILHLDGLFWQLKNFSQTKEKMTARDSYLQTFIIFANHREELLKLKEAGLDHLIFQRIWDYNQEFIAQLRLSENLNSADRFALRYQLGGLMNILIEWILDDMLLPAEAMAKLFEELNQSYERSNAYLPKILVQLAKNDSLK